jgi:serine/threonine protein kinase
MDIKVIDLIKIDYSVHNRIKSGKFSHQFNFLHPKVFEKDFLIDKKTFLKEFDIYSIGCLIYFAITQKIPFAGCNSIEELMKAKAGSLEASEETNEQMKKAYDIANKCLNQKEGFESVEKLKEEFSKLADVEDFIKNETINFNYNEGNNHS